MRKVLLLIRHAESLKNIKKQLSSDVDKEALTLRGKKQAKELAKNVSEFVHNCGLTVTHVYCADSSRAIHTGTYLAGALGIDVVSFPQFKSFSVGIHAGKSEAEIERIDPSFIADMALYRKSLLNSYNIIYQGSKDTLKQYENSVSATLHKILDSDDENCKIVIMHRSALTASLLDIARAHYNYPKDFYGYIQINLATISLIEVNDETMRIHFACMNSKHLSNKVYVDRFNTTKGGLQE